MPQGNSACLPQLLSLCPRAHELQLRKPTCPRARAPQQKKPPQCETYAPHLESSPLLQLGEAQEQQQRPSAAKK